MTIVALPFILIFSPATAFLGLLLQDIEIRIKTELALQHSEARLRATLNAIPDVLFVIDEDGRYIEILSSNMKLLYTEPSNLLGKKMHDVLPQIQADSFLHMIRRTIETREQQTFEYELATIDGLRDFEARAQFFGSLPNGKLAIIFLARDTTDRKSFEKQLNESKNLLETIINSTPIRIFWKDKNSIYLGCNPEFAKDAGKERPDEVVGRDDYQMSWSEQADMYRADDQNVMQSGIPKLFYEEQQTTPSGQTIWLSTSKVPIKNANNETVGVLGIYSDISERKFHEADLYRMAFYDTLTTLPNRVLLTDHLNLAMAQARRHGKPLAVVFLDIDDFKPINDQHGHDVGDQMLMELANSMKQALREGDTLARLGGDEFSAVLLDVADETIALVLNRLLAAACQPIRVGDFILQVSASIGITFYPQTEEMDADQLLRQADNAMYQAKQAGKNRYHLFDAVQDRSVRRHHESLEHIRQALSDQEFVLHYQPKVDMVSGDVTGAEALIRWQHPEQGLLSPGAFLHYLEGSELEIAVGEWVIDSALKQIVIWNAADIFLTVSVNISADHLLQADFADNLRLALARYPSVDPACFELEILETVGMSDMSQAVNVLSRCRELGVRISLDDFGTGYSSLTYLRTLPVDVLKIDQSFVRDMLTDPSDLGIVVSVIQLAQTFSRDVIAEGVETLEHGAMLVHLGCRRMQGYGIARPMPADQISEWIVQWRDRELWHSISREDKNRVDVGEGTSANFAELVWHNSYESGNSAIDREHKNLFADANNLMAVILSGNSTAEVNLEVERLINNVEQHFRNEEAIFLAANYPDAYEHMERHKKIVADAHNLADKFRAGKLEIGELFSFLAQDVVAQHMLHDDRKFFPYLEFSNPPLNLD